MAAEDTGTLTPKQERAIVALLSEPTIEKAAAAVGVHKPTLYRWMREPVFGAKFRAARRDTFTHAISLTQKYVPHAVQTLAQIMADKSAPSSARVSAATSLMKFSRESIELDDLAERVERLEHASDPKDAGTGKGAQYENATTCQTPRT